MSEVTIVGLDLAKNIFQLMAQTDRAGLCFARS